MNINRLVLILPSYYPYKDLFDIFVRQLKKNWPDRPFPLVIANMHFDYEGENAYVINCGNERNQMKRIKKAVEQFDADYYFILEDDRIIMNRVDTEEIYKILDFMDNEKIPYFRSNASVIKKKKKDLFHGYSHYYHILAKEPYGVTGSTVIWSKNLILQILNNFEDAYAFEAYQVKKSALSKERWYENYATYDSNLLHIVHCIEKQKWIPSSRKKMLKEGVDLSNDKREIQSVQERTVVFIKYIFLRVPGFVRHGVKKLGKMFGIQFSTDY